MPNPSNSDLVGEALQAWKLVRSIVAASAARDSRGEDSEALAAIAVLDESIPELAQQLEQARDALRAYGSAYPCPGIEVEPGLTSGCDGSGGDCPTCAALTTPDPSTGQEEG